MVIEELWTSSDAEREATLVRCVAERDLAGALLAIEGADGRTAEIVRRKLGRLGRKIEAAGCGAGPEQQSLAMATIVGKELGFVGGHGVYDDPKQSHLSQVLSTRGGLPILLSLVWIMSGELANITVEGVGFPGHFLARVGGPDGSLVDPYRGGEPRSVADCRAILRALGEGAPPFDPAMLNPVSVPEIFERVLRNLIGSYARRSQLVDAFRMARFAASLRPDVADLHAKWAYFAEGLGDRDAALAVYELIVRRFPETEVSARAQARIVTLGRGRSLN